MNTKRIKMRRFLLATIILISAGTQAGDNKWRIDAAASFKFGADSSTYLGGKGLSLEDRTAYRFGFNRTIMDDLKNQNDPNLGTNFLGGSYRLMSGYNRGQLDVSLDTHFLNSFNEEENGIQVFSPQLAYLSFDRKLYLDLGYAYSHYEDTNSTVHQLTPTLGFTFNNRDWFQVRGYFIDPGDSPDSRALYAAAEGSWVHRFSNNFMGLSQIKARALLGRRLHSVDQDLKTVNYFQDEQGGSLSFSLHWSLPYNWGLMFQNSIEEYYRADAQDPYRLNYGFFGIERRW